MDMSNTPAKGYRTVGIDADIPWPSRERFIDFRGRRFHLLPATDKVSRMIRVETATDFTQRDADRMIFELLSALAWAEQGGARTTYGNWATAPLDIGKGPMGIAGDGHFDYLPDPADPKAKLALALYREGLSVNLTPYKFLGFFKVINIIRDKGDEQKKWIRDNLQHVADQKAKTRIAAIQSAEPDLANYLYKSGRCAVAHAFDQSNVVNPDDPGDLIRLEEDLPVIRELARIAIEREFGVKSTQDFDREHLYELAGFRAMFGDALVGRIKTGEELPPVDVPIPKTLAFRLRDRERLDLFESMDAAVEDVRRGCVRLCLRSRCQRLVAFVTLDFGSETLMCDPLTDIQPHDDGTPEAANMMLQWAQLHRWWFGGNGVIELWDTVTDKRMARSKHYLPPVNSRFPYDEFEKMQSDLRARAGASEAPAKFGG
jgi:hypothetical protein